MVVNNPLIVFSSFLFFLSLLIADVNREDVCDLVLDKDAVEQFERAVDQQVGFDSSVNTYLLPS
jgi:hypothetical protein